MISEHLRLKLELLVYHQLRSIFGSAHKNFIAGIHINLFRLKRLIAKRRRSYSQNQT